MSDVLPLALLPCIKCGAPSEVSISVERSGAIAHYGSCMAHIEQVAGRMRSDLSGASFRRLGAPAGPVAGARPRRLSDQLAELDPPPPPPVIDTTSSDDG